MKSLLKPFSLFCIALTLLASIFITPVMASSLIDSRVSQLEFQVRSLQTQLSQLQSSAPRSQSSSSPSPVLSDTLVTPSGASSAEQFDNLATLVIEINQRLKALEAVIDQ